LEADRFGQLARLCPCCHVDLTGSVRSHMGFCTLIRLQAR
jgi:hypothetical protein